MIKSIGQSVTAGIEAAKLRETAKGRAVAAPASSTATTSVSGVSNPASRMAALGAPVDMNRVAQIKEAIASGHYPVDADKIAARMLDLDLPIGRH